MIRHVLHWSIEFNYCNVQAIETSENMKYLVHASYLEIYNEEIRSRFMTMLSVKVLIYDDVYDAN